MTSLLNNNAASSPEPDRIAPPGLLKFSDEPVYNTKAAVRLSGVPAPTLRAWERRYGVLAPERAGNTYRLYSERDVAKICWLREQVERGISIRQAVTLLERLETRHSDQEASAGYEVPLVPPEQIVRISAGPVQYPANAPDLSLLALRQNLLGAFLKLDEEAAERVIISALTVYSVEELCAGLLEPVMIEIGERWAQGDMLVTVEHFASAIVRSQLGNLLRTSPRHETGPLVLVGCAPQEHHEIGLLMVALFMRRQGWRVVYLGQNVPAAHLMESVRELRPALVCLSCSVAESLGGMVEVSRQIASLPSEQRPLFSFGGQIFKLHPELTEKLPGYYLGSDAADALRRVQELARRHVLSS